MGKRVIYLDLSCSGCISDIYDGSGDALTTDVIVEYERGDAEEIEVQHCCNWSEEAVLVEVRKRVEATDKVKVVRLS